MSKDRDTILRVFGIVKITQLGFGLEKKFRQGSIGLTEHLKNPGTAAELRFYPADPPVGKFCRPMRFGGQVRKGGS